MGLLDFLKKIPTANEMIGGFGEWMTKTYANSRFDALVLHDVLIDGADGYTSQSDVVMVGNKGVYVIEVKSFADAKIYGDVDKTQWNYYSHGQKYTIYNPLKQNAKHVQYFKTFLKDFGDVPFFSVVVMICEDFKISGEINKGEQRDTMLCNSLPSMEKSIEKLTKDRPSVLSDEQKQAIFDYIQSHQHQGKEARAEHKQQVIAYKEKLEQQKEQKICPYCHTELVLRNGKNGEFYGCRNFPKCRYTMKK